MNAALLYLLDSLIAGPRWRARCPWGVEQALAAGYVRIEKIADRTLVSLTKAGLDAVFADGRTA